MQKQELAELVVKINVDASAFHAALDAIEARVNDIVARMESVKVGAPVTDYMVKEIAFATTQQVLDQIERGGSANRTPPDSPAEQ